VSGDVVEAAPVRAKFTVTSYADMLRQQYGNISYNYAITTGAVRWPFPFVSPISSGFGGRVAPCRGCSSMHMGLDFVPGAGTPIYAIADGVISEHKIETWGLGNSVVISHTIGGKAIDSVYAHMQTGSVVVEAGQEIKVGDLIGLVGSTGTSTGSHLHFEIHIDGVQVDPYAWLQANVKN
jgi:murein DD-endopeptidase MepM/ murein hydrolase activator NlpD